jgi:hypothetical protein
MGVEGVVHRIKHHALFSSVHHGFSTEVCIIYIHIPMHVYICTYSIQYIKVLKC